MREPQHPPKPAFDQAHDDREAWRQQELARLNDRQIQQYQELLDRQREELDAREKELDAQRKDDVADSMRKQLSPLGQPRHQMSGPYSSPHIHDLNRARESVDDHLKGKDTPETERYAALLNDAQAKAEKQLDLEQRQTLQNYELKQQNDRDRILREAEKERLAEKQQETAQQFREAAKDTKQDRTSERFNEAAKDTKQDRTAERFNEAAKDQAWQQALEQAAEQEANRDLEQERDHTNDPDRQR